MKTLFVIINVGPIVAVIGWAAWRFWKMHRHHKRFMAAAAEVDKAVESMKGAQTREQLNGRAERTAELLEHLDAIRKERP